MMIHLEVEVRIRKGLSEEFIHKNFPVGFDDLPEETTWPEIKDMARAEVEQYLYNTEDFNHYGRNWEIIAYHQS